MTDPLIHAAGDTPTHRVSFSQLTKDEQDQFITALRERRLAVVKFAENLGIRAKYARSAAVQRAVEKQCRMADKEADAALKAIEKLEKRIVQLRALEMELEDLGVG